jgi:hypothetical protein
MSSFGILGLAIVLAAPASAQTLAAGKWTGTLQLSTGATIQIEFMVQGEGDAMQIVMKAVNGPPQPVTDLELSDKEMSFVWGAFNCSLERKGDSKYEGECGGAADGQLSLEAPADEPPSEDVLTGDELVATEHANVYDALRELRRRWLIGRTVTTTAGPTRVAVFVGSQRMGGVDFLRNLDLQAVREVRFYSGLEATTLFGTDAGGGVIQVTLR